MTYPVISADSHITEHPNTYIDYIDAKWKDKAPVMKNLGEAGDVFVIDGMKRPVPLGLVAAAGKPPEEIRVVGSRFEDLHRGGWDPEARMEDQKKDGVAAEIIYPTVGMVLCNHEDFDYKQACLRPTTAGSPNTARRTRTGCWDVGRPPCARPRTASPSSSRSRGWDCTAS